MAVDVLRQQQAFTCNGTGTTAHAVPFELRHEKNRFLPM